MTTTDYVAETTLFTDWFVTAHEYLTIINSIVLALMFFVLLCIFAVFSSKLDKLLAQSFKAELFRTLVTLFMGFFLYMDWADGVKTLVVVRPWVLLYVNYAIFCLLKHYLQLFGIKSLSQIIGMVRDAILRKFKR